MKSIYELHSAEPAAADPLTGQYQGLPQGIGRAGRTTPVSVSAARIRGRDRVLFPFEDDKRAAEEYRIIGARLLRHSSQPSIVAVSSADVGDGKTVTSANLAGMLSLKPDTDVILVDADLRRGRVAAMLGLEDHPGLTNVLSGEAAFDEALVHIPEYPRLHILTAGDQGDEKADLLDTPALYTLLKRLRKEYRMTIIDTMPLTIGIDSDLVLSAADGVVLVIRPDHTNRSRCLRAMKSVPADKMLGVVVNGVRDWIFRRSHETYYYVARTL